MTDEARDPYLSQRANKVVLGQSASLTRKMFELADQMRRESKDPVYDLSLGNPSLEPPDCWREAVCSLLQNEGRGMHRYMINAGYTEVRSFISAREAKRYQVPFEAADVTMTVGAAGALNVVLRSIVDASDEILVPRPYFTEYDNYCDNVDARLVSVPSQANFDLDLEQIAKAITPKTRAILLNSPNNPSGAIYSRDSLRSLAQIVELANGKQARPILVIEDSPYRDLVYDNSPIPSLLEFYPDTLFLSSHSKDLGLAGERIGYVLISPHCRGRMALRTALSFYNRTLGFVNAPALMQRALPLILDRPDGKVDVQIYAKNSKSMASGLSELGFEINPPRAGFFLFPRLPEPWMKLGERADFELTERLSQKRAIVVPGTAFAAPGHLRISTAVDPNLIEGAISVFRQVIQAGP